MFKKNCLLMVATVLMSGGLRAQTPKPAGPGGKIGIVNIQGAIASTADGQKAAKELDAKYGPKQKDFESRQSKVSQWTDELRKGSNTLSEARRSELQRQIDDETRKLQRDQRDTQEEFANDRQQVLQSFGQKMIALISKYANDNGYSIVLDTGADLVYASSTIDITQDIVSLYDKSPASASPAASVPGSTTPNPAQPGAPKR